jgi:hypothetical protein
MPGTARGQFQSGDLYASINGTGGNGSGSVYQYHPDGTQTTFAPGLHLDRPRGLAFDNTPPPTGPNLFVATNTRDPNYPDGSHDYGTIFKITPSGVKSTFATGFPSNFFLQSLVTDSAGNVFVAGAYNSAPNFTYPTTIYKIPPGGTVSPSPFGLQTNCNCSVPGDARGLAFDSSGNLYAPDSTFAKIYKFTPDYDPNASPPTGSVSVFASPPAGLYVVAFDSFGNLFGSIANPPYDYPDATSLIFKFNPAGAPYEPTPTGTAGVFATSIANPRGLAFDSAGNLFVADIPASTPGNILEFTPDGTEISPPSLHEIGPRGNGGPEYLAFVPGSNTLTPAGSPVPVNAGTVGFATISLTFPQITSGGTTTVIPVNPSSAGYTLPGSSLAFDITTTAAYPTPVPTPPGIVIAFQVAPPLDVSTLTVFHNEGGNLVNVTCPSPRPGPTPDTTTNTIYASVTSLSPFVVAKVPFAAHVQQPINSDGSSVFNANRGVVPVKFTLTQDGNGTCTLPTATIAVTRTAGGTIGAIDESVYSGSADTGSNFRISSCQYVYNLNSGALGVGTYRVDIKIGGIVVGSASFGLR